MASDDMPSSATNTGLVDRRMCDWSNTATGELVPGVFVGAGQQVVDVGCGDGGYIGFCAKQGADVTFVDVQEAKVRALENRLKEIAKGTVKAIVSDCNPIPLPDGYADVVISTEVLEHVRDPEAFLNDLVRIGRSDAYYVLTVPDARGEMLVKDIAPSVCFEEPNHIQIFSSQDFEDLVDRCGLKVVRHEYISAFWAIFYLLKWATTEPGENLLDNVHPATHHWTLAWDAMLKHPNGRKAQQALNHGIPRCQVIVARRK